MSDGKTRKEAQEKRENGNPQTWYVVTDAGIVMKQKNESGSAYSTLVVPKGHPTYGEELNSLKERGKLK